MIFKIIRWVKFFIAILVVFNAFQIFFIGPSKAYDPLELVRRDETYFKAINEVDKSNHSIDGSTTQKVSFLAKKQDESNETITRTGLLTLRPRAKGTVLICHGYTCNKFDVIFLRTFFPEHNCFIFDFRAHGEQIENQLCTFGKDEVYDIMGAVDFIKNNPTLKKQKLYGYGFSMGAASLIEAEARKKIFDALILDCPFDNTESIVDAGLERLYLNVFGYSVAMPGKMILKNLAFNTYAQPVIKFLFKAFGMDATKINSRLERVSPVDSIKKISIPCFFIHCKNDEKISLGAVKKIFERAAGFKKMWVTNGRGHCDSFFFNPEKYKRNINNFLETAGNFFQGKSGYIEEDV